MFLIGTSNSWYEYRDEWVKMREQYPDYPLLVVRYEDMLQVTYSCIFRNSEKSQVMQSIHIANT